MKIDYLYCDDPGHDKIYAVASNTTHTVFLYGSRTKGDLKNSIKPLNMRLHDDKVSEKMQSHGSDGNRYHRTDRLDVRNKVDQTLRDIKFMDAQTPGWSAQVAKPVPAPIVQVPQFTHEPCPCKITTDPINQGQTVTWEVVKARKGDGSFFQINFNSKGDLTTCLYKDQSSAAHQIPVQDWMQPYVQQAHEKSKYHTPLYCSDLGLDPRDVDGKAYRNCRRLFKSEFNQWTGSTPAVMLPSLPIFFKDCVDTEVYITQGMVDFKGVMQVVMDSLEPAVCYRSLVDCIRFHYPIESGMDLTYQFESQVFCTCADVTGLENHFEKGMDYLLLSRRSGNLTVLDMYGEEMVVPLHKFINIRWIP